MPDDNKTWPDSPEEAQKVMQAMTERENLAIERGDN